MRCSMLPKHFYSIIYRPIVTSSSQLAFWDITAFHLVRQQYLTNNKVARNSVLVLLRLDSAKYGAFHPIISNRAGSRGQTRWSNEMLLAVRGSVQTDATTCLQWEPKDCSGAADGLGRIVYGQIKFLWSGHSVSFRAGVCSSGVQTLTIF